MNNIVEAFEEGRKDIFSYEEVAFLIKHYTNLKSGGYLIPVDEALRSEVYITILPALKKRLIELLKFTGKKEDFDISLGIKRAMKVIKKYTGRLDSIKTFRNPNIFFNDDIEEKFSEYQVYTPPVNEEGKRVYRRV